MLNAPRLSVASRDYLEDLGGLFHAINYNVTYLPQLANLDLIY